MSIKNKLFFTVTLVILILPLLMSGQAQAAHNQEYRASFSCLASGGCIVFPDIGLYGSPPAIVAYTGMGTLSLCGSAKATLYPASLTGLTFPIYVAERGVKALGMFTATWSGHKISLLLFSRPETSGAFVDPSTYTDLFTVGFYPISGQGSSPTLSYSGIYITGTGVEAISGKAVVAYEPKFTTNVIVISVYRSDGTPLATIGWAPQAIPEIFNMPAADIFKHSIKITLIQ